MALNSKNYFNQFQKIIEDTSVTDSNGNSTVLSDSIDEVIKIVLAAEANDKKIIIIGNGGSASIADHITVDLWKNGGIKATSFSSSSLLTCVSNDFGYEHVFEKPIEMFADDNDVLIAISSSGKSANILKGVESAKRKDCTVITMSGFEAENPLRSTGQINFYVPSNSYGFVELAHLGLCHCFTDIIIDRKNWINTELTATS